MILAIDVGKGTEDILIYDNDSTLENSIQVIVPSTANLLSKSLKKNKSDKIIIDGEIMAGEPWHKEIYERCNKNPFSVIMSETSAKSLRYNLNQVKSRNVKIVDDARINEYGKIDYFTQDISWERIDSILKHSQIDKDDISKVLLCCQDHGEPRDTNQSTRDFRMKSIYTPLQNRGKLADLLFSSSSSNLNELPRLKSITKSAINNFEHLDFNDLFVMDSSPAVILGASEEKGTELIINVGNGHTVISFLIDGIIQIIYELHTGGVNPDRIWNDIIKLSRNELSHQQALNEGAHGVFIRTQLDLDEHKINNFLPIKLIGPNRNLLNNLNVKYIHPIGNMMMAGPYGLIRAFNQNL